MRLALLHERAVQKKGLLHRIVNLVNAIPVGMANSHSQISAYVFQVKEVYIMMSIKQESVCSSFFRSCSKLMETSRVRCTACSSTPHMSPRTCCSLSASRHSPWAPPMSMTFQRCSDRCNTKLRTHIIRDHVKAVTFILIVSFLFPGSEKTVAL